MAAAGSDEGLWLETGLRTLLRFGIFLGTAWIFGAVLGDVPLRSAGFWFVTSAYMMIVVSRNESLLRRRTALLDAIADAVDNYERLSRRGKGDGQ